MSDILSQIDPVYASDQMDLQRRMALSQALREQSLSSLGPTQSIGGVAIRQSPWQGVAKLVQALSANYMDKNANQDRNAAAQRHVQFLSSMLDKQDNPISSPQVGAAATDTGALLNGQASTVPDMQNFANAQAQQPQQAQKPFGMSNLLRAGIIADLGGAGMGSAYAKNFEPTDTTRLANAAGQNVQQANAAQLFKANQPTAYRSGSIVPSANGSMEQMPGNIEGSQAVKLPNGQWAFQPLQNAMPAMQAASTGAAYGKAAFTPMPTYDPASKQMVNVPATALLNGNGGKPLASAPPLGVEAGATAQQSELSKKWTDLNTANQQAQITNSYLQNIKSLAAKAATGPGADKKEMVNGLLSLVGNEKATDATTANNLLDKYQGQIVARLGQGGMGTDAARSLLQQAYPGAHMNVGAINEAVGNLVGANDMIKAKASLLSQHAANRDPGAYQQNEVTFDQNADPRIWQWKSITDPAQKKAFAAQVIQQDPNFAQKIHTLESMGALK